MARQPSEARVAEYDRLRHFCSELLKYLKTINSEFPPFNPLLDFWRAGHSFSESFSGLRQAVGDFLEMTRDFTGQELREADAYLTKQGAASLTEMHRQIWQLIPKILKRGKIRNDEEYYLLKERAISMDDPEMSDETRRFADRLVYEYECKARKPN